MDLNFEQFDYVDQQHLLFDLEGLRGEEELFGVEFSYDHGMNQDINQRLASYPDDSSYSISPDIHIDQTHSLPIHTSAYDYANTIFPAWSPSEAPSHHSFTEGFGHHVVGASTYFDYSSGFSSPVMVHKSPDDIFLTSPVDIPRLGQAGAGFQHLDVAAGLSSNSSWDTSVFSMSRTDSVASHETSTTIEEPMPYQSFGQLNQLHSENPTVSNFLPIQYRHDGRTNRLAPGLGPSSRKPRGRRGPLNEAQRRSTARMREQGACQSCRDRKAKCDSGIPCKQCINYYKCNLIHHPCRGQQLQHIADKLLKGHIFPRKRDLGAYLGPNYGTWPNRVVVYVELGFGEALSWPAEIVSPYKYDKFDKKLIHEHVVYEWPHDHSFTTEQTIRKHYVFPALLADAGNLKEAVDRHLTKQIDNPANFNHFPLYNSPLTVLTYIYDFYRQLGQSGEDEQAKSLLGQAFKLLNLIHIGGDTRISNSPGSRAVINHFFAPSVQEHDTRPCFIRAQLGEIFSELAKDCMKEVLSKLEFECLNKNCRRFPLIVCTFMVLFMAVESIQFHTHKKPFHLAFDGPESSQGPTKEEIDGMTDLLQFYKNCFAGCHRDRILGVTDKRVWGESGRGFSGAGEVVLQNLRSGVQEARDYLTKRSKESLSTRNGDITVFFDRLVAKLVLLED